MKQLYYLRKNTTIMAILFSVLVTRSGQAQTEINNEFWISTSANTANLGTLDNPFDGSTATKFDLIMNSLPPNSTIHILAGTYQTYGSDGWKVQPGQKILGSGMDVTVLQLVPNAPDGDVVMMTGVNRYGTNNEVADLTCDCNYTSGNYEYSGINIEGTGTIIRRVKVINQAGFDNEAWGISVYGCGQANCGGNIIEDCEVSHFAGGRISALSISDCSGVIRDNRVLLAPTPGGPPAADTADLGINGSEATSVLVEGNYVNGATAAMYGDTSGCTNIIIAHNQFINCMQGITYYGSRRRNITMAYNVIDLSSNGQVAFYLGNGNPGVSITNVIITGNTIDVEPQNPGTPYVIAAMNVTGILCYGNMISGILASNQVVEGASYFIDNTNLNFYNNYDLLGNLLPDFYQKPPCTMAFNILPPNAYVLSYGRGSVTVGQIVSLSGSGFFGWNCTSNANASLLATLPLPNDYWDGKTNYVTSWKLWTTNAGTFVFNTGLLSVYTNGTSDLVQNTATFTTPARTNVTTIAVTNLIPTVSVDNFQTLIYTGDKIQPGNYAILSGKVSAQ